MKVRRDLAALAEQAVWLQAAAVAYLLWRAFV